MADYRDAAKAGTTVQNFRDVSLAQYREWIGYHQNILADIEAGTFAYKPKILAEFKERHEYALRELRLLHDFYAEHLPN